ncbi:MAG: DNA internalization-related competence protein ComEC/Rec2 [Candidatus Cloacimonetes bacterium]|nr:DNA internalization-related competence protein ComEC/Rec2 [Candidatus Cloacimonadota bacterium]
MQKKPLPAPLLIPVLAWCAGIAAGKYIHIPGWPLLGLGLLLLALALWLKPVRPLLILLLCVVLGALRWNGASQPTPLDTVLRDKSHIQQKAEFVVTKLLSREAGIHEIRLENLAGVKIREPLTLISETELIPGQAYTALLEVLPGKRDPVLDTFPARHIAYVRQGLAPVTQTRRLFPIAIWRARFLRDLDEKLGPDPELAKALLFSDTSAKKIYRDQLTRSGMIHLIVVSGLHIWFIYAICMVLLNALFPKRLAEMLFMVLIVFYAALNHWSPPVTRAVLMIGLMILARWRSIPLGGAQLLALSLLIITAVSPDQLFNIGLQLSFVCIGVIILGLPRIHWIKEQQLPSDFWRKGLNRLLDLLLLNLVVGLAIMPLTLHYFGTASLNGILGNIPGIPLSAGLLILSFLVLLVPAGNWLSAAYIASYSLILRIFTHWTEFVSGLPFWLENTWIGATQLLGLLLVVGSLLYLLRRLKFSWKPLPFAGLGLALVFLPQFHSLPEGGIYLFACGTGDCILANFPGGETLLVDSGPKFHNAEESWAARKLLPWLHKKGIRGLDWMVLTHLDSDHSGGFTDLAKALPIKNLIVTDETSRDPKWAEWEQIGLLEGIVVHTVTDTISFGVGGARLKFLHPDRDYFAESSNGASLVFRLDHLDKRYLFTGDADIDAEAHLLARYPEELKADFLKAGHHGSRTSSSREFVRAVRPEEVWITVSGRNQWGFPHPEPMSAFRRYARRIRSTAEGTIFQPFAQKD